jgi:hypothetical protein
MPVSGLVVTLAPPLPMDSAPDMPHDALPDNPSTRVDQPASPAYVIEQITKHPHLQVGPRQGHRLPVVVDTPDKEADKHCWLWLNELQGVHHVDVAFIHFEDEDAFDQAHCKTNTDQLIQAPTIGVT